MKDTILAGTGNSRYLKTSLSDTTTWAQALEMLRAGTFPIDLAGINMSGIVQLGTALTSDTLLKSAVITALNLDENATPSDAWEAVIALIAAKQDELTFDSSPTQGSQNPVRSGGVYTALAGKQDTLVFDTEPTAGSTNPVTSGGIADAIAGAKTTMATLTIPSNAWTANEPHTASVTVTGYNVTINTRIDVACNYATMNSLAIAGVSALYVENDNGTLTAYAIGAAPSSSITVNALIYETNSI